MLEEMDKKANKINLSLKNNVLIIENSQKIKFCELILQKMMSK